MLPGRYVGRTTHMHLRVRRDATGYNDTTQLFFPESVAGQAALSGVSPYSALSNAAWSTTNSNDNLYAVSNVVSIVGSVAGGYVATYTLVIPMTGSSGNSATVPTSGTTVTTPSPPPPAAASGAAARLRSAAALLAALAAALA